MDCRGSATVRERKEFQRVKELMEEIMTKVLHNKLLRSASGIFYHGLLAMMVMYCLTLASKT